MNGLSEESLSYFEEVERAQRWLINNCNAKDFSELGARTAVFLQRVYKGIYHLNSTSLRKVDWSNEYGMQMVIDHELATVDYDLLTMMVVLAHQMQLRVAVTGAAPKYLRLTFSLRPERNGAIMEYCPDIEAVVSKYVAKYPALDRLQGVPTAVSEFVAVE